MSDVIAFLLVMILIVGIVVFSITATISEGLRAAAETAEVEVEVLDGYKAHSYGDIIHLVAKVKGVGTRYSLQWQVNDGSGWESIPGANGVAYAYELKKENRTYQYRVIVNAIAK